MSRAIPATSDRRARLALLLAALSALFLFAGTLLAPVLDERAPALGGWVRMAYTPVCHQLPARSLTVAGGLQAVCARCSGLYLGGVGGLTFGALWLARSGRRPRLVWLAVAVAPTFIDAVLPWVGLPGLPNVPRMLLGIFTGAVVASFLAVGIAELFRVKRNRTRSESLIHDAIPVLEDSDG